MCKLAVPLESNQVAAAARLYSFLEQWKRSDYALQRLTERCPGFDREETLLKVVAINGLYGTNVYAQVRMAEHLFSTLQSANLASAGPELVEHMANLPETRGKLNTRRHISFASKFAHFFLNASLFPIFDQYAAQTVVHHLGRRNCVKAQDGVYLAFAANVQRLLELSRLECHMRELNRYLWLAGLYRRWQKSKDSKIDREVGDLFASESAQVVRDLSLMAGDAT
jgi:hypothetical protein